MNDDLKFNPELHEYSLKMENGQYEVIPGVSDILQKSGITDFSMIHSWVLKKAQDRGTEIHKITEEHDRGNVYIPNDYTEHKYFLYLNAWCDFLEDYQPEIKEIEIKTYSRKYLYAGTIDRILVLEEEYEKRNYIVDIKCGGKWPSYPLQLAAYRHAYIEETGTDEGFARMCVYLTKEGTYKVDVHRNQDDIDVFLAAIKLVNWKKNNVS